MTFPGVSLEGLDEGQRLEAERELEVLAGLRESNPLSFWGPFPEQAKYLGVKRKPLGTKLLAGGNRAGKTEVGMVDDLIQCVDRSCLPERLWQFKFWEPPFHCRVISPSFRQQNTVVLEKVRKLVPKAQLRGGQWRSAYDRTLSMLHFKNGSWLQFLTAEQDVDVHAGVDLDRVHFDEEPNPPEKGRLLWQENLARLIDRGGQMVFTMTPLLGLTFTYDEIYEKRFDEDARVDVVEVSMDANPHIDPEARRVYLSGLTEDEKKARRDGMFVHFQGRVFDEFSDSRHVVERPRPGHVRGLEVVVGIDPGIRWTGVTWTGFDTDNAAVTFADLLLEDHTVDRVAERIRAVNAKWGVDPMYYVIDPSARNRALTNAQAVESEYMMQGIPTVHGQNDVEAGVMLMRRRLQTNPPAWHVTRDCQRLIWEIGRYRIDEKADGKFAVVKAHDHELDSVRYALTSRPWDALAPDSRSGAGWRPRWVPGTAPAYRSPPKTYDGPSTGSFY